MVSDTRRDFNDYGSPPMPTTKAYAAFDTTSPLRPFEVDRREPRPEDVAIDILYCGICHSDLHQVKNDWGNAKFPMVPGE